MQSKCSDKDLEGGFLHLNSPPTPSRLQEIARKELGETEERKAECLSELKKLIRENDVPCIMTDDFLLCFLRYKKFRIQKSFEVLKNYSRMRASIHEKLMKLSPGVVKKALDLNCLGILPYRDHEERLYFTCIPGNWNPSLFSVEELVMIYLLVVSYIADRQTAQVVGFNSIYYDRYIPISYLVYLVRYSNFLTNFLFECLPSRYPKVHLVSDSFVIKAGYKLVEPFLPTKIKQRCSFHDTVNELAEHMSPSILPDEFGGNLGPLNNDHVTDEIISYLQKMKDEQKYFIREK